MVIADISQTMDRVFVICRYIGFALVGVVIVGTVLINVWQASNRSNTSGMVTGIVGPMGSGKSYAAVRMAVDRIRRGCDVVSNFHLDLDGLKAGDVAECDVCGRCQGSTGDRNAAGKRCKQRRCMGTAQPRAARWSAFRGWDEFAELRDCVVIVDEAHLHAPSHAHVKFPMIARWALSHSRKHGLDLYWLAQDEERVNTSVRALTNRVGVCESYFSGRAFRITFYEPRDLRKPKRHTMRRWYRMDTAIADRYDTSQLIESDEYALAGDASASKLRAIERKRSASAGPADAGGGSASPVATSGSHFKGS